MVKILLRWTVLSITVGLLVGFASFGFYQSVNWAIEYRKIHSWVILFLPIVGMAVSWVYLHLGHDVAGGNNLILDEIHEPKKHIKFRMVPMIFISSVLSHLFGASVGREGAAVQIGAGISDQFSKFFGKIFNDRRIVLMMGMSAGFASIFGAPIAGTIFGMEVLLLGAVTYEALFPCLISAIVGNYTTAYLGMGHPYHMSLAVPSFHFLTLLSVAVAGVCFGLAARFFVFLLHKVKSTLTKRIRNPIHRPFIGGLIVVLSFYLLSTDRYLGLGEEVIKASLVRPVYQWDFLGKIIMTSISVGSGFKGGEVMSLFYIGSTLGNALSFILPLSLQVLSALGFVAVFAGAANTPIAGIFLAIQLFGSEIGVYAALAIVMSYLFSGQDGLYQSQRKHLLKKL